MEPEGTRSSTVCVGFSSPSGRCCQVGKLPHPLQQASACLLSVAKAWSAGISRTLDFLLCIARQGWQQAGDRESGLWGGEQEEASGLQHEVGSAFTLGCQGHDGGGQAVLSEWARVAEADGHQRKAVTDPR